MELGDPQRHRVREVSVNITHKSNNFLREFIDCLGDMLPGHEIIRVSGNGCSAETYFYHGCKSEVTCNLNYTNVNASTIWRECDNGEWSESLVICDEIIYEEPGCFNPIIGIVIGLIVGLILGTLILLALYIANVKYKFYDIDGKFCWKPQ